MTLDNEEAMSIDEAVTALSEDNSEDSQDEQPNEELEQDADESEIDEDQEEAVSDADDLEDDQDENDDQDQDEQDEEQADSVPALDDYTTAVKMPDGTTGTVQDLLNGQMAHSDYTRKTQEFSEEKKKFATRSDALQNQTQVLSHVLNQLLPPEPTIDMLDENSPEFDPTRAMLMEKKREHFMKMLKSTDEMIQSSKSEAGNEVSQASQQRHQEALNSLAEQRPELLQPEKWADYKSGLVEAVNEYGLPPELLSTVEHAGVFQILEDAMAFRKAKKAVPSKKTEKLPQVVRSSKQKSSKSKTRNASSAAFNRLNQTGSSNDAVAYLMSIKQD